MKYLKWPLLILLALVLIYVLLCAIGPKNMNTSKTTSIEASSSQVFNLVNNLKKWETWSPWSHKDTTQVITYGDKFEGLGGNYSWKGDVNGSGDLKITESLKNESTKVEMNFHDWDSQSMVELGLKPNGKKVDLTWSMIDAEDFPFLLRGLMLVQGMKGKMADSFEQGLANIKGIAEERAAGKYNGYEIKAIEVAESHFVMNRQEVDMANMQQFYATNLGSLFGKIQSAKIEMAGKPCGLYFKWDEVNQKTDMAAGIPVQEPVSIAGASTFTIPMGTALQIDFYGDYSKLGDAHMSIDEYMKDYGLLNNPPMVEEYVTDPVDEKDPAKWLTKITYYLAD